MDFNKEKNSDCCDSGSCAIGNEKHIKGIVCDVRNCVYHDGETYCTAGQIAVGPSHATSSTETACATFKQKRTVE